MTNNKLFMLRKNAGNILMAAFRYILLICLGFVILTPIISTVKESITAQSALGMKNSVWIPSAVSMQSLIEAYHIMGYGKALLYSIFNTGLIALLQTACAAFAAYSFARLKFKGSGLLFGLVVFTIIMPPQSIMLTQYMAFKEFDILGIVKLLTGSSINLINNPLSVYILAFSGVGIKGGLYIYLLRQAFRGFPISIEEAAYVDGAGFIRTFATVVLPGVSSTLLTVGVLSFVWNYADTYFMGILNSTKLHMAIRLGQATANIKWALMDIESKMPTKYVMQWDSPYIQTAVATACALLTILPLLVLYSFVQKQFVEGVSRSGLGGD